MQIKSLKIGMKIASASFLAMFIGWVVAFGILSAMMYTSEPAYFQDKTAMLFWPALFMTVAWVLVVLPVLAIRYCRNLLSDFRISWLLWTILALASFAALIMWWMPIYWYIWFAAVAGFAAGVSFPLILKADTSWRTNFSIPALVIASWFFVVWPLAMRFAIGLAYPLGSGKEQSLMMDRIVPQIKKGMTFDELDRLMPGKPLEHFMSRNGYSKSFEYSITMKHGKVSDVKIAQRH